jgi:hypothetical protein
MGHENATLAKRSLNLKVDDWPHRQAKLRVAKQVHNEIEWVLAKGMEGTESRTFRAKTGSSGYYGGAIHLVWWRIFK